MARNFLIGCLLAVMMLAGGCATVTGTVTGALTGAVDAPAETYRHNREAFEREPMLFGLNAVGMGAVGIVTGPIFGLGKGLSLDVQCLIGQMDYGTVFWSYDKPSIWRPHTVRWPSKKAPHVVD